MVTHLSSLRFAAGVRKYWVCAVLASAAVPWQQAASAAEPVKGLRPDPTRSTPTLPSVTAPAPQTSKPSPNTKDAASGRKQEATAASSNEKPDFFIRQTSAGACPKAQDAVWFGLKNVHDSRRIRVIFRVEEQRMNGKAVTMDNVVLSAGEQANVHCGVLAPLGPKASPSTTQVSQLEIVSTQFME